MSDDPGGFGALLGAWRRSAMLSQEELAELSGLSIRTVRNLERARTRWPYPDSVRRLADALQLRGQARAEFIVAADRRLAGATHGAGVAFAATAQDRLREGAGGQVVRRARPPGGSRAGREEEGWIAGRRGRAARAAVSPAGIPHQLTRRDGRRGEDMPAGTVAEGRTGRARSWVPVFQLPAALADFTGRVAESERLINGITPRQGRPGVPLVVVSGPPGAGKTSLMLHAAHSVRARFGDGQLWVHLAGTSARPRDPGEVLGEILRALGLPGSQIPSDLDGRAARYRSCLAGRKVLVVADDAASVAQVRPLLPGTAQCAMVVTSRARLEGLDGAHLLPLDVLSADDAVSLLAAIVGADRVAAERAAARSLALACAGLPLALRIVGAKLATRPAWPLSVMAGKVTGAQDRLRELESADLSVRASIASSYHSLNDRPRRAFGLLALLGPADFAEWAVAALLGEPQAADVVAELESQSLLTAVGADATGEPRFRLHDLLRDFAAERLDEEPAASKDAARRRALAGWLQLASLADTRLPPEPCFPPPGPHPQPDVVSAEAAERLTADPIAWFTAERVNLLAAVEQACEAGHLDLAWQLASCQCAFQHHQDRHDDAERQWRLLADSACRSDNRAAAAYARLRVGASLVRRGQAADALPILQQCVNAGDHNKQTRSRPARPAPADRAGPGALALALYWRSICAADLDDPKTAKDAAKRGLTAAQEAGTSMLEYMNLSILGTALAQLGEDDQAIQASKSALAIAGRLGGSYELEALIMLAYTYTLTGQHESAIPLCQRAIELSHALGDISGQGLAQGMLGDAYHGLGHYQQAAANLHQALPIFQDHSGRHFEAVCLLKLGHAHEMMGSPDAISYLEQSLHIFRQLRMPAKADRAQQALTRCQHTPLRCV